MSFSPYLFLKNKPNKQTKQQHPGLGHSAPPLGYEMLCISLLATSRQGCCVFPRSRSDLGHSGPSGQTFLSRKDSKLNKMPAVWTDSTPGHSSLQQPQERPPHCRLRAQTTTPGHMYIYTYGSRGLSILCAFLNYVS